MSSGNQASEIFENGNPHLQQTPNPSKISKILLMVQKIWRSPVEVGSLSHYLQYKVLCIPGGAGFLPSTIPKKSTPTFTFSQWVKPKKNQNRCFSLQRTNSSSDCVWRWQSGLTPIVFHPWPIFFFSHVATSNAGGLGLIPINGAKDYPPED